MTVAELIADLQQMPQDATVCVYADHGQAIMSATTISERQVLASAIGDYLMDAVEPGEFDKDTPMAKIVEIGAP